MPPSPLPVNVWHYGKAEPLPEQIALRAGPLSLVYEAGDVRYVRLGEREVLRRVYMAVRDAAWGTILPRHSNVRLQIQADSFEITYDVEHCEREVDFFWHGRIVGDPHGCLTVSMEGEARSTFWRSRIGFCVLHPIRECAGAAARVEHVDGTIETANFPVQVVPQHVIDGRGQPVPPFSEMAAVSHEVMPGAWAEVRFAGEIFEMEDQRNWLDGSYKTYGTPLRLPLPVEIQKGSKVIQSITVSLGGQAPLTLPARASQEITLAPTGAAPQALPRIGLGSASHAQPLARTEVERLRALALAHLRVDLHLSEPGYEAALRRAWSEAQALGTGLEAAIFVPGTATEALHALLGLLVAVRPTVNQWLVFHADEAVTPAWLAVLARDILGPYDPRARLGIGTNRYFAELNRQRPTPPLPDLLAYSFTPQVHAFDNASIVEGLEAVAATVETARQFGGEAQIAVSPITLKGRFGPATPAPGQFSAGDALPPQVDERQMSLFGAGWTVGCLKHLAESGVASTTFYETTGWRGVMETESGSPMPDRFRALPGSVFPIYHVLADVGEFAGGEVMPLASSDMLKVDGLALWQGERRRMLLANFTGRPQSVTIHLQGEQIRVRTLDETTAEAAMRSPEAFRARADEVRQAPNGRLSLELLPYAVVRIDSA
jgi:hypothetical protein